MVPKMFEPLKFDCILEIYSQASAIDKGDIRQTFFQDKLIEKMKTTLGEFYPEGPAKSADYPRLVNDRHFQ